MSTSSLCAGVLSGVTLCRTCACYQSLCGFMWVSVLLCLEMRLLGVTSSSYSVPASAIDTSAFGRGADEDLSLRVSTPKSLIPCTLVSPSVNFHPLQEVFFGEG